MLWLDAKYAAMLSPQLNLFKRVKDNLWQFRCPICGDSAKDKTKCRGYFYPYKQNLNFRCHNCGASQSFYKFLEEFDSAMFKEYKLERFKENHSARQVPSANIQSIHKTQKKKKGGFGFPAITDLIDTHPAVKYVLARKIPARHFPNIFYADGMKEVANKVSGYAAARFDNYPRILLPFINADGVTTHVQGRAIGKDVPKSNRYITLEIEENAPKIYGQSTLLDTATVFVVEGPLDSLFLHNCCAMGGSDIHYDSFDPENTTFVFDNERRNPQIIKRMERVSARGFGVCVWGKDMLQNDINDMIVAGYTCGELKRYIREHTFRGMRAKMQIIGYKKCDTTYKKSI